MNVDLYVNDDLWVSNIEIPIEELVAKAGIYKKDGRIYNDKLGAWTSDTAMFKLPKPVPANPELILRTKDGLEVKLNLLNPECTDIEGYSLIKFRFSAKSTGGELIATCSLKNLLLAYLPETKH